MNIPPPKLQVKDNLPHTEITHACVRPIPAKLHKDSLRKKSVCQAVKPGRIISLTAESCL